MRMRLFAGLAALVAGLVVGDAARRRLGRQRQDRVRQARLLAMSRLSRAGRIAGPKLASGSDSRWRRWSAFLRSSNRTMPPYREAILSDADIADIHAYLAVGPEAGRSEDDPAAQSIAAMVGTRCVRPDIDRPHGDGIVPY